MRGTAEVDLLASGEKMDEDLSLANALGMQDYASLLRYQQQKHAAKATPVQAMPPAGGLPSQLRGLGQGTADAFAGVRQVTPEQHAQREADLVAAFSEPYGFVGDRPVTVWEQQLRDAGLTVPKNASAPIHQKGVAQPPAAKPAPAPAGPAQPKSQIAKRLEKNLTEMEEDGSLTPEQAKNLWDAWNKTGKTVRETREFEKQLAAAAMATFKERNPNAAQAAKTPMPAVSEEAQSGEAVPADELPGVAAALTARQRQYWEARTQLGVTDESNDSDAQIAAKMGISRQRVSQLRKETLARAARIVKDKFGMSLDQAKEMLRAHTARVRQVEEADVEHLGLSPAEQASTVEGELLFGNENGAEASMGVINTAGGSQGATETERNDAAAQFLKAHGTVQAPETIDNTPDAKTAAHAAGERAVAVQQGAQTTLHDYLPAALGVKPVDIEDAAADWDAQREGDTPPWGELPFEHQAQWVKLLFARYSGNIGPSRFEQRRGELVNETKQHAPVAGAEAGNAGAGKALPGGRAVQEGAAEGAGGSGASAQRSGAAEEDLTPETMQREWNRAAKALSLPAFAQLTDEQQNYILGSANMDEFNEAADEVANELVQTTSPKFSEDYDETDLDFTQHRPELPGGKDADRAVGGAPRAAWAEATIIRGADGRPRPASRGAAVPLSPDHFRKEALGVASKNSSSGLGVWTYITGREKASRHGDVEEFYLDIRHPKFFDGGDNALPRFESVEDAYAFREKLRREGYDGIICDYRHLRGDVIAVAFDPHQFIYVKKPKFSEAAAKGGDAKAIISTLKKLFFSPDKFDSMVTVVQSAAALNFTARQELSQAKDPSKVQAFVGTDGRVYLIADNIAPGRELAVFLHEVGVHLGMEKLIGKANMQRLSQQIAQWAQQDGTLESRLAQVALKRALAPTRLRR